MPQPPTSLDARIRARIDVAVRLTTATAHELGGTMLPSLSRPSELKEHTDYQRLMFQCTALADHLVATKNALDMFRAGSGDQPAALAFDDWWPALSPLLNATLAPGFHLQATSTASHPFDAHLTRGVTLALLAATLDAPQPSALHLAFGGRPGAPVIRITGLTARPTATTPTPPALTEHWPNAASVAVEHSEDGWTLTVQDR